VSRRWLLVAAGAAALIGAVPARNAVPVAAHADDLRRRILDRAAQPWVGLAEATGRVGLPELPALESTTELFTGVTRIRGHFAGPDRWRADELTPVGERDVYYLDGREYVWDFGFDQLTTLSGNAALRLPRAADLLPPELVRRLLRLAPDDPVTPLPARRVGRVAAAGLRLTPADPDTTVGRIDVWADPATGLPLHVEIAPRAAPDVPLLVSTMHEVAFHAPDDSALVPPRPPGSSRVRAEAADLGGALRVLDAAEPPSRLAGRARIALTGEELPASACTARGWRGSCSSRSAAGSPAGCSTGPLRRVGYRSRSRVGAPCGSGPRCCRWRCADSGAGACCWWVPSRPRCWSAPSSSCRRRGREA
jgi:hypothetical protein